jgi:NAD(P)H-dependent glutamate synthase small subunit
MRSISWAIKDTIRVESRRNLMAFNMGRKLVVQRDLFPGAPQRTGWKETLDEKCRYTIRRHGERRGRALAERLRELVGGLVGGLDGLDGPLRRDAVVRAYDCMRWGGIDYARRYADRVRRTCAHDSPDNGYAVTRAVIHNLAKAMLIQDGVFIAELATSPEKHARDRRKYNIHRTNGDRIHYVHYLHSCLHLGRREIPFHAAVPHWALRALKRMKLLRRLPGWHRSERAFLAAYEARVEDFARVQTRGEYLQALTGLSSPRCMDCLSPRCREAGCPLDSHIPQWVRLAEENRWREALDALHETNNFPELTAHICPAPCQSQCKQAIGAYPVQIRRIEREIIERGFRLGWVLPKPPQAATGRKVAIVGSGPAGLAAAQQLARAGHDVTVFEREEAPGGLLRYGIPGFRLDRELIDRRVRQLRDEGVAFRTGVTVGRDVSAAALREQFDAVLLATGAARPRDLQVPGRNQAGVHFAMEFLRQQNLAAAGQGAQTGQYISVKDKVVAVIGGGETGNDCVELACLQGAKEIHQLEILPEPSKRPVQFAAPREGPGNDVERRWSVATKRFAADGGHITGLQAVQVEWFDSIRGPIMREKPGSGFSVPVDLALLALGFDAEVDPQLAAQLCLEADPAGRAVVKDCATSVPGVFAAGDFAEGASLVVHAIRSGRKAAETIDKYLREAGGHYG